jgi:uncharacterized protein YjdB
VTVLTLDKKDIFIYKGEETEVKATVGPEDINVPFKYSWISSDESIFRAVPDAEDPSKAVIKGLMGGFATLYVQAGDVTTSIPVTIDVDLAGLVITGMPSGKVFKGDKFQLGVAKDPIDAIDELSPVWSSSDENVFTVDQTGLVTVMGPGTATITVESNGFTASAEKTANVLTTVSFYPNALPYTIEDVTFNTTGSRYASYMYLRSNNTLTFTVPESYKIVEIKITTYSSSYKLYASANTGSYDQPTTTWTGESNEVVLTNTGSATYLTKFTVTYKD